jgi:hypothetical protein
MKLKMPSCSFPTKSSQLITAEEKQKVNLQVLVFTAATRPTTTVYWFTMIPLVVKLVNTDYIPLPNLTLPNCLYMSHPTIERSHLDGSQREILIKADWLLPNALDLGTWRANNLLG